ncbi:MAG: PD-(D/E)XK nuclease family protein, partial [Bacteroidales bacterium]|nr:PD-(D/E)XK nuclease family protein [Bacteroidales bacterium]
NSLWSLMNDVATLQLHLRNKKGAWFFYHKQVQALASNAVFRSVLTPEEKTVLQAVSEKKVYYLACDSLGGSDLLEAVFRPVVTEPAGKDAGKIADICRYQLHLVTVLAGRLKEHGDMAVELDFARAFYESVSRLEQYGLAILPQTYFRLLTQLVGTATVPFTGEPLKGLQIMGPLETRALDFDKLVILGCNEGSFPRRSVSTSFIPPELRRGFDLPAYEYKDAVWAYYFYRMIQRASEVWMVCDTRTEGVNTGEPSRYIRQLELHFKKHIIRHVPQVSLCPPVLLPEPEKTQEQIDALRRGHLSASALNAYFDCPAKFYYGKVCGLKEDQDVVAYLDAGMFGTVFHAVMQKLYQARLVDAACLQRHLQDEAGIRDMVRREIFEQLSTDELSGRNILYADVIVQYVRQALRRDWELLEKTKAPHFEVLGVELRREVAVDGYTFVGYIDRLDSLEAGKIRVVDYKTGRVEAADLEYAGKRFPHIGMQLYLYRRMLEKDPVFAGKAMEFSVYQTARLFVEGVEVFVPSPAAEDWMAEQLHGALAEISDVSLPWKRTAEPETCQYCPFKLICGK